MKLIKDGIFKENPVFVSFLGMCPILAVSISVENALGMGIAVIGVLLLSNLIVSLIRDIVPSEVRIPTYIVIIASLVTITEMLMAAFVPALFNALGIFIPLIVVNCVILGRAEAFASKNGPIRSILDAIGMGLGFTVALVILAFFRELLGTGSITLIKGTKELFGMTNDVIINIFTGNFPSAIYILPAGAFLTLGLIVGIINTIQIVKEENAKKKAEVNN